MFISKKAAALELKRRRQVIVSKEFEPKNILFPAQLKFIEDTSPNKVAVCSRRAGKTISCAVDLINTCLKHQEVVCLYLTLNRASAKRIIWKEILKLNKKYGLGGIPNLSELSITFSSTGSTIYLSGANDASEIEKFRGMAIKLCYIDEAQSFRDFIKDLIDDVLSPALMDYAGTLCLLGTPGPVPTGYFHDVSNTKGSSWSQHSWTFWDNPFIIQKSKTTHAAMLQRELDRRGVQKTDPSIQREWFGKWEQDKESLLIKYDAKINNFLTLPYTNTTTYQYILGIDLGFNDADALAVLAYSDLSPTTYLVEESVMNKQGLTELVEKISELKTRYNFTHMVIDEGGLGKKLAEEMRRRHQLPVKGAEKARKMENIAFLNDALRTGRFMAKSSSRFAEDTLLVEIDRDKSTPDKIKVSERYHSDIIDAVLYAFKLSPAYAYQPPAAKIPYQSDAWYKKEVDTMYEQALERAQDNAQISQESDPFDPDFYQ